MEYKGLSISYKLLFSFLSVVLLLSGILAINFFVFTERNSEKYAKEQLLQSFKHLYHDANENLIKVSQHLDILSGNPIVDEYLMAAGIERELVKQSISSLFKKYADQNDNYRNIVFIDFAGNEITKVSKGKRHKDTGQWGKKDLFRRIEHGPAKTVHLSSIQKDADGGYSILFGINKTDPDIGEFAGAIIIEVYLDFIFEKFDSITLSGEKIYWIFSSSGEVLKKPPQTNYFLNPQSFLPDTLLSSARLSFGDHGLIIAQDIEYPKKQSMVRMAVSVPHNLLHKDFSDIWGSLITITITSILVVVFLTLLLSRYLSQPIIKLAKASANVMETGLSTRVDVKTSGELDVLVNNFNSMLENLESTTDSKEFVETVLNSIHDEIAIINVDDFTIARANHTFLNNHLKDPEENINVRTCHELIKNQDKPCSQSGLVCPVEETCSSGRKSTLEVNRDHGIYKLYFGITAYPIKDETGKVTQVVYVSEDITDRKKAELQISEQQETLAKQNIDLTKLLNDVELVKQEWEATLDCINDMVLLIDSDGRITRCNQALRVFSGLDFNDIHGKVWSDLLEKYGLHVTTDQGQGSTELYQSESNRWFMMNKYQVKWIRDERQTGMVVTISETTLIRKIAAELEEKNIEIDSNRQKLHEALEKLSAIIQRVAREEDFSIRIGLPALTPCYEYKQCKMTACPCFGKEASRCWQVAGTYCLGENSEPFIRKTDTCEKCNFYIEMTKDEITRIGEQFNNMMYILENKNIELQKAYQKLKDSQGQILQQEKMASIGQLAAGVAHEINNPLGFIISNLGTLDKYTDRLVEFLDIQNDVLVSLSAVTETRDSRKKLKIEYIKEDLKDLLQESLEGADRVKEIVQNLKTFSRVDQQEEALADINENIESTLKIIWNELKYKTTVHKEFGELPKTLCFPQQLNQVFMNILVNAAHAIETQGDIHIKTWHADDSVFISLSDTGKGISEENLSKIFEPFFTTKEVGKGTGLGMSIVYEIIKNHNGNIHVESIVGKGTTFTIQLPVVIERSEAA